MEETSVVAQNAGSITGSRLLALAVGSNNTVYGHHRHYDDDDESYYVYRERPRTVKEKVGECLVSITCTSIVGLVLSLCVVIACVGLAKIIAAIMFWSQCPASPNLPVYLLVSGLMPAVFYITCRTRKKYKGAISGKQRILARWEYSVLHYTFDTDQSWQAGLAGLLCVFLTVWLCLGTALTVVTMRKVEAKRDICSSLTHPQLPQLGQHNASSSSSSSGPASLQSLSLLLSRAGGNGSADPPPSSPPASGTPSVADRPAGQQIGKDTASQGGFRVSTLQRAPPTTSPASADLGKDRSGGDALSLIKNSTASDGHIRSPPQHAHGDNSNERSSSGAVLRENDAAAGKAVADPAPAFATKDVISDVRTTAGGGSGGGTNVTNVIDDAHNVTHLPPDEAQLECLGCERRFLTVCFSLVLFDWAYFAALVLNLVIVGTVPCCCFKKYQLDHV